MKPFRVFGWWTACFLFTLLCSWGFHHEGVVADGVGPFALLFTIYTFTFGWIEVGK